MTSLAMVIYTPPPQRLPNEVLQIILRILSKEIRKINHPKDVAELWALRNLNRAFRKEVDDIFAKYHLPETFIAFEGVDEGDEQTVFKYIPKSEDRNKPKGKPEDERPAADEEVSFRIQNTVEDLIDTQVAIDALAYDRNYHRKLPRHIVQIRGVDTNSILPDGLETKLHHICGEPETLDIIVNWRELFSAFFAEERFTNRRVENWLNANGCTPVLHQLREDLPDDDDFTKIFGEEEGDRKWDRFTLFWQRTADAMHKKRISGEQMDIHRVDMPETEMEACLEQLRTGKVEKSVIGRAYTDWFFLKKLRRWGDPDDGEGDDSEDESEEGENDAVDEGEEGEDEEEAEDEEEDEEEEEGEEEDVGEAEPYDSGNEHSEYIGDGTASADEDGVEGEELTEEESSEEEPSRKRRRMRR